MWREHSVATRATLHCGRDTLEALKGEETVSELASRFGVYHDDPSAEKCRKPVDGKGGSWITSSSHAFGDPC